MKRPFVSEEDRALICELRSEDKRLWTQAALAKRFGVSTTTVQCILDPELDRARKDGRIRGRARMRRLLGARKAGIAQPVELTEIRARIERDAREHLKKLPEDNRTFTQRFCGDPLPGRSALDRQRQGAGA